MPRPPLPPSRVARVTRPLACAGALLLLAGCGSPAASSDLRPATPATPTYLSAHDLQRDLANGVHAGLERLAVMEQPRDGAADLGQDLPAGSVDRTACRESTPKPAGGGRWPWTCHVTWTAASGRHERMHYVVALLPNACFAARATPPLSEVHDATIQTYAEHPLNVITSLRRGC